MSLQGVRCLLAHAGSPFREVDVVGTPGPTCAHCGSANVQQARRSAWRITFRCLHCWKTFTFVRSDALPTTMTDDDEAA